MLRPLSFTLQALLNRQPTSACGMLTRSLPPRVIGGQLLAPHLPIATRRMQVGKCGFVTLGVDVCVQVSLFGPGCLNPVQWLQVTRALSPTPSPTYIVVFTTFVSSLPASQRLSHQRYYIQRHNDGTSLRLARFFHTGEIPFKGFEQL